MLLDEGDKNFVCERARLTKARVGTDDDILFLYSLVELDLLGASRRAFCVVAKQRTGDAQQRVLHEHLVMGMFGLLGAFLAAGGGHTCNKYSPLRIDRVAVGVEKRLRIRRCPRLVVVTDVGRRVWIRRPEERREQALQSADQNVGLAAAFGQFLDLQIFGRDLPAQKFHFPFEAHDIARRLCFDGRGLSRHVGAGRGVVRLAWWLSCGATSVAAGRDKSRLVALASSSICAR